MLAAFKLDVPCFAGQPRAQGMHPLAAGLQQPRDRILRQPVHLQVRMQLAQFARDGDVAAAMAEADRRRKIEGALLACRAWQSALVAGAAMPSLRSRKSLIRVFALCRIAAERVVATAFDRDQFRAGDLGVRGLRARIGLDLVVVAVDEQHRAADPAVHLLADVECGQDRARVHRLDQRRSVGLAGPADPLLDLLGRMRLVEDVADEELREVRVILQPVVTIELVPALVAVALGREMRGVQPRIMRRSDGRDRAGENRRLHALGMVRRDDAGEQAAEREPDEDRLLDIEASITARASAR